MAYLVCTTLFALWVLVDGSRRGDRALAWSLATVLLGPLVLPFYFAGRSLKRGERREGGRAWNVLKNFALVWTVTMVLVTGGALLSGEDDPGRPGAAFRQLLDLGTLGAVWLVPMLVALVLGAFLKTSEVETGPEGR